MSTQAEGGHDGVTAAGPDNKFDGAGAHPEVDGCTDQDIKANIRIRQSWMQGEGAAPTTRFVLGDGVPD